MADWSSKTNSLQWWEIEQPRTAGFYEKLEAEARNAAGYYTSYVKAWRSIQPLLEYFAEDEQAITSIKRGFNTDPTNGGWQDLPDHDVVHNPFPKSRITDNRAKKID